MSVTIRAYLFLHVFIFLESPVVSNATVNNATELPYAGARVISLEIILKEDNIFYEDMLTVMMIRHFDTELFQAFNRNVYQVINVITC